MEYNTNNIINGLDLVYIATSFLELSDIEAICIDYDAHYGFSKGTLITDYKNSGLKIFGAVELENATGFPTPVFCIDTPKTEPMNNYTAHHGLIPEKLEGKILHLSGLQWHSRIDVQIDGNASVYLGHGGIPDEADAYVFSNLVPFDPKKQLIYVRSPNNNVKFQEVLHTRNIEEPTDYESGFYELIKLGNRICDLQLSENLISGEAKKQIEKITKDIKKLKQMINETNRKIAYSLIYENINELKKGRTWERIVLS